MVARKPRGTTLIVVNGWSYDSREFLGGGGNGDVFRAEKDGRVGALKLLKINLKKLKSPGIQKRVDRFRDEVEALKNCADIPGVIPVFEADTAPRPNQRPWLVMGLAIPLAEQLGKSPSLRDVFDFPSGTQRQSNEACANPAYAANAHAIYQQPSDDCTNADA